MKEIIKRIRETFKDKKKRYLYTFLFSLPVLIVIVFLTINISGDVKDLLSLVNKEEVINTDHVINENEYVLRDNATDYQFELFTELKNMLEGKIEYTKEDLASSIVKNYIADFYTWSNKTGQYDIGGMYYVYPEQKEEIYLQARDGMYKYLSKYISDYGANQLLEVESITTSCSKMSEKYVIETDMVSIEVTDEETGEGEYVYWTATDEYEAYKVVANWTYVAGRAFSTSKFDNKMTFTVIVFNDQLVIAEVSK